MNCKISGTQPLCYAHDLIMENCTMADDADLAFEHSSVKATIKGPVHSVKNPRTGNIVAESFRDNHPGREPQSSGKLRIETLGRTDLF